MSLMMMEQSHILSYSAISFRITLFSHSFLSCLKATMFHGNLVFRRLADFRISLDNQLLILLRSLYILYSRKMSMFISSVVSILNFEYNNFDVPTHKHTQTNNRKQQNVLTHSPTFSPTPALSKYFSL